MTTYPIQKQVDARIEGLKKERDELKEYLEDNKKDLKDSDARDIHRRIVTLNEQINKKYDVLEMI